MFRARQQFLDAASRAASGILVLYGKDAPRKSKAEMTASLGNVKLIELSGGELSFYEEFPDETAEALSRHLGAGCQ